MFIYSGILLKISYFDSRVNLCKIQYFRGKLETTVIIQDFLLVES